MRFKTLTAISALSLAFAGVPLSAQSEPAMATSPEMSTEQTQTMESWPADRRTAFGALAAEQQSYFWTLTPSQMEAWWVLTETQRGQIMAMAPDQRVTVWTSIEAQIAQASAASVAPADPAQAGTVSANPVGSDMPATDVPPNPETASSSVPPAMPADPSYQATPYKGALTSPPPEAMSKSYPVCTSRLQDSCQNPGEGGAPKRSRRRSS